MSVLAMYSEEHHQRIVRQREAFDAAAKQIQDEHELQMAFGARLRRETMAHLRTAKTALAKTFRGDYAVVEGVPYERFLAGQSKEVPATYIEAAALGDQYGCHVVVTPIKKGEEQSAFCLHRAENDKAPVIHLYNSDNAHWHIDRNWGSTSGQGNHCLYHAFAQGLSRLSHPAAMSSVQPRVKNELAKPSVSLSQNPNALFKQEQAIIEQQRLLWNAISKAAKPSEMLENGKKELERIRRLSKAEQQQIADDYQFALRLAAKP